MKNTGILLLCLTLLAGTATAQRQQLSFDSDWKFSFGHSADPAKDFNYTLSTIFSKSGAAPGTAIDPRFDDSRWRKLNLPHDWAVELPFVKKDNFDVMAHGYKPVGGLFPETSIGWYRKHFMVAAADSGQRFQLQFDGIFRDAEIWLNGFYIGNNKSGYVGVNYDITDYINYQKDNVLVVRADASQYEGWFYEGAGIYRHVWLNKYPNAHIATDGVFAWSDTKGTVSTVHVETTVENRSAGQSSASVYTLITDRSGKKIAQSKEQAVSLTVNGTATMKQALAVPNARKWSLTDPYLYRVIAVLKQNGKTIDSVPLRVGIRTIEIKPNVVFLNGEFVKLKGVNNHQDHF